jgi:hypothetical protein
MDPKADRKRTLEELKRKQKASERRKTALTFGIASLFGLGLIAAVVVPAVLKDRREKKATQAAAKEAAKPVADFGVKLAAADCGEEKLDSPMPPAGQHVEAGVKVDYPASPPDGGKHDGSGSLAVGEGFYSRDSQPPIERAVHSLEHGAIVGWYDKALPSDQIDALRKIGASAAAKGMRFIAVPWDRQDFSDNKHFVLTSWGHTQRCGKVSGEAVDAFAKKNTNSKDAPEAGAALG